MLIPRQVFWLVLSAISAGAFADSASFWEAVESRYVDPRTGLVYEYLTKTPDGTSAFAHLPTPDEIKDGFPNPCGWRTGMEDGAMRTSIFMLAALEDLERDSEDSVARERVRRYMGALFRLATVSKEKGFLARSVSPVDGISHYGNSSRDQYTFFFYAMHQALRSSLISESGKSKIRQIVVDCARRCERDVTPENEYYLTREDGRPAMASQMWTDVPANQSAVTKEGRRRWGYLMYHEVSRILMFYAIAHEATGEAHWREMYEKYADDILGRLEQGNPGRIGCGELLQVQLCHRLLFDCETSDSRKERWAKLLAWAAERAMDGAVERGRAALANTRQDLSAVRPNWRMVPMRWLKWAPYDHLKHEGVYYLMPEVNPWGPEVIAYPIVIAALDPSSVVTPEAAECLERYLASERWRSSAYSSEMTTALWAHSLTQRKENSK